MNLAAIKMEEKVIRAASESVARAVLDQVVPTLIKVSLSFHTPILSLIILHLILIFFDQSYLV